MPVEANASIRVNVPDLQAEIEIECLPHNSFWHLKLCLVDGILSKSQQLSADAQSSSRTRRSKSTDRERRPLIQLVANSLKGRNSDKTGTKSCMPFTTSQSYVKSSTRTLNDASVLRCHSSVSSLTSTDTSSGSAFEPACSTAQHNNTAFIRSQSQIRVSSSTSPTCYYGFSGVSLYDLDDDNARQSSDLAGDEEAAVRALALASADCYAGSDDATTNGNYNDYSTASLCHFLDDHGNNRRISDLLELDERDEYNVYETLRFSRQSSEDQSLCSRPGDSGNSSVHKNNDDDNNCDKFNELGVKPTNVTTNRRLFEQILQSGYLNYGFYSFSLAKFIDDQTCLTEYLSLVSSSTGASYYLDLEFKLKQRQQIGTLSSRSAYAPGHDGNAHYALHLKTSQTDAVNRLSQSSTSNHSDIISLKSNRLSSLNLLHCRIKRTNSISALSSNESRNNGAFINLPYQQQQQQSFANNMIAKLASSSGSGGGSQKSSSAKQATKNSSSSQCKRKRSKMLDLLLNTHWSKQSQQASNLMKLNKVLLVCDTNFLDEKTGESPLSLAISSPQINAASTNAGHLSANLASTGCSQSASLFDLQCQHPTTSHNQLTLQQTSAADLSQSKAPLVEKILLLLVKSGALIDFRNNDGRTPLHIAAMKSNFWALKTLLDLGASTDYCDINGLTPLYYSILHRAELKVTQLLLNNMSNKSLSASNEHLRNNGQDKISSKSIGISDQQGWQEVHQACKLGLDAHLDKLLYHGCDINAKISGSGNTPLHVAAINDQLQAAKVLLLRGADRTITNNSHQTAHQVAVISNNMDLAEFIASHDDTKVVPFSDRSSNLNKRHSFMAPTAYNSNGNNKYGRMSMPPNQLVNSDSSCPINKSSQQGGRTQTGIVQSQQFTELQSQAHLNPLTLDVANHYANGGGSAASSAPSTNTSGSSQQTAQSSLLSINSSIQHQSVPPNNISPCLSQRSCGTSNTTTSSGVCCDGDNHNSDAVSSSQNQPSNITIISIGNGVVSRDRSIIKKIGSQDDQQGIHQKVNESSINTPIVAVESRKNLAGDDESVLGSIIKPVKNGDINCEANEDEDISSSESSSNGNYSLMSSDRPLFAGAIVEATSDYQSGDPNHLQLRREDLIEVLEYPDDFIRDGQLPRLANKPMLFGRRQIDGTSGLFPSFCVRRTKRRQPSLRQRIPMADVTNLHIQQQATRSSNTVAKSINVQQSGHPIRGNNLPGSQSMVALGEQKKVLANNFEVLPQPKMSFREYQVTLTKINEGFGFVLRGAKINPATLSVQSDGSSGKISIDERLMMANNLASLQYLDDIESNSVAHQAGLKRGDFLIAVNNQDVRLCSHENVVQMIRSSGDRVHLTIASPIIIQPNTAAPATIFSSKTLTRVKPEPPKRDPTTTLTRNKSQKVRSMSVAPQMQQQSAEQQQGTQFDANKPLPNAPAAYEASSPVSSSNLMNCSISANIAHNSITSLSSVGPDSQSITSISTVGSVDQQKCQDSITSSLSSQHQILDQSSSSTTTLTTVATTKPQAPAKPSSIFLKTCLVKNQPDQSTYQSAAVFTNNRSQPQVDLVNSTLAVAPSANKIPEKISEISNPAQVAPAPPPLPPPPPPPLPNFSNSPSKNYLSNRRTSAPTNQCPSLIDGSRISKKRESIAAVGTDNNSNLVNGPAPICAVAAACAAAANSRLQRQQQKQQEEIGHKDGHGENIESNQSANLPDNRSQAIDTAPKKDIPDCNQLTSIATNRTSVEAKSSNRVSNEPVQPDHQRTINAANHREHNAQLMQSATLGRKSSAQIIQQPKQNSSMTHSQTLRAVTAPKRMSILDYEMPPPPPPPQQAFVDQRRPVNMEYHEKHDHVPRQQQQQQHQNSHQHQHQHRHHGHQLKRSDERCNHQLIDRQIPVHRFQQDIGQQQIQNQHQLIMRQQQQLRQQQILQERLAVQQHQQTQQRVCQHFHSATDHEYGATIARNPHQSNEVPNGSNDIHPRQHQKAHGVIGSQNFLLSQHQQLHTNHDMKTTSAIMQQQQLQQQHKHNHHQHHHHHSHHHQAAASAHHGQDVAASNRYHHHHQHNNHVHHDQQQQQRISQQQHQQHHNHQQQHYLPYIETNSYVGATLNR